MSAPTPLPVPRQRDSSGLDAAVAARSMHPSIPWTPGDGLKHGRASSEVDAGTRCGKTGPLELAGKDAGCCGACFPPAPESEWPAQGPQWAGYLRHVHFADTAPVAARDDLPPVAWCSSTYFNGIPVTRRLPRHPVSVTFGPDQEPRLTIGVHAGDVVHDGTKVRVLDWPVLTPPIDVVDLPARLAAATGPDDVVEVVLLVAKVTVGAKSRD